MSSKLILACVCAYLSLIVSARPQQPQQQRQWQRPDFQNQFLPNRPGSPPSSTTPAPTPASSTSVPSPQYLTCLRNCPSTMEYNPVCGSDSQNYHNQARLDCAVRCGQAVSFVRMGTCTAL